MRQVVYLMLLLISFSSTGWAQGKMNEQAKPAKEKTAAPAAKKGPKLKKDGTPDRRYKENKGEKASGPRKKDGTPDMRHKANKQAAKTK